jgi:YfiH family protein
MVKKTFLLPSSAVPGRPVGRPDPSGEIPYLEFPSLASCAEIRHAVYTRHGGVSQGNFRSLNVGLLTGDRPENVRANLAIIRNTLGARSLKTVRQVHGTHIAIMGEARSSVCEEPVQADAMITALPGVALVVKQADCQAVILFDPSRRVVSNIHCGWRGHRENLIGTVVDRMRADFGCKPSDLRAGIGPSLGPCCGEFVTHERLFPGSFSRFMVRRNYFDFWAISRWQLREAGVKEDHIETAAICTKCNPTLFYSYRAEGTTGRFATAVMLR